MYRKSMENNMLDELKEDLVGIDIRFEEPLNPTVLKLSFTEMSSM